jgi:hypothetical protein
VIRYESTIADSATDQHISDRKFASLIIRRLIQNERALVVNIVSDPPATGEDQLLQVLLLPPPPPRLYLNFVLPPSQLHPNMEN